MVSLPGSRFAAAMSSPNVFQGRSEFTISSTVPVVTRVTGAKSRAGSSGIERRYRNLLAHRIEAEPSSSVYPSFSPLATTSAPRLPPAPPRFSTSTFCPSVVWSRSARKRPVRSTAPPGAKGTTMRTGRVGKSGAWLRAAERAGRVRAVPPIKTRRLIILVPPAWLRDGTGLAAAAATNRPELEGLLVLAGASRCAL